MINRNQVFAVAEGLKTLESPSVSRVPRRALAWLYCYPVIGSVSSPSIVSGFASPTTLHSAIV